MDIEHIHLDMDDINYICGGLESIIETSLNEGFSEIVRAHKKECPDDSHTDLANTVLRQMIGVIGSTRDEKYRNETYAAGVFLVLNSIAEDFIEELRTTLIIEIKNSLPSRFDPSLN